MKKIGRIITISSIIVIAMVISIFVFSKTTTYSITAVVEGVGQEDGFSHNKFHTPTQYHTLLIRDITDSTKLCELSVSQERYYNTLVGDSINIKYIINRASGDKLTLYENKTAKGVIIYNITDVSGYQIWFTKTRK